MLISAATPDDIRHVALNMRDADFDEFSALGWTTGRDDLAALLVARFENSGCLCARSDDGERIAVGALVQIRPNVGSLLFYATDLFPEIANSLTRFIVRYLFADAMAAGMHRIEAVSKADHHQAHRWIEALRLKREATFPGYGRRGETYIQFSWVSDVCKTGDT